MSEKKRTGKAFIGCSGFSYEHWRGVFYPEDLLQKKWLEYYAKKFSTVELNVTFYRVPKESAFEGWRTRTPEKFIFVVKGSKLITHLKSLKDVDEPVSEFISRAGFLKEKLGLILWQLKPSHKIDLPLLKNFTEVLKAKAGAVRHAFEFRNQTWFTDEVYALLKEQEMTFCFADYPSGFPEPSDEFSYIYIRRHGPSGQAYRGCYSEEQLKELSARVKSWLSQGKDVYVYFNNDIGGYAPKNALYLKELIG